MRADDAGSSTAAPGAAGSPLLPCLSSNNSNEQPSLGSPPAPLLLGTQKKKSACALAWNVQALAERVGLERVGFLTLTFAEHVVDPKEAQKRFNSLATGVLRDRYPEGFIRVFERQKSRRIHYHLLVVLQDDVRTDVDFDAFARGDYRSAPLCLRNEWAYWRKTAKAYKFGRTELMPIRSTSEGIARYVGKYIGKNVQQRNGADRGVRLVEYSKGARIARTRFGWSSANANEWRCKVRLFAQMQAWSLGVRINDLSGLTRYLGPRWAWNWRDFIASLPLVSPPLGKAYAPNGDMYDINTGELVCRLDRPPPDRLQIWSG